MSTLSVQNLAAPERLVHRPRIRQEFNGWQPVFAEHRIATFPLNSFDPDPDKAKKPAVKHYRKLGMNGSRTLAQGRFATAPLSVSWPGLEAE